MRYRSEESFRGTVMVSSLLVAASGLLVFLADGLRCLGGDCGTEWWIWTLMLGPLPVAAIAAGRDWGRRDGKSSFSRRPG